MYVTFAEMLAAEQVVFLVHQGLDVDEALALVAFPT